MAWTDRKSGYLELCTGSIDDSVCGYYRGDKKFLTDFFISMKEYEADLFRSNALYTDVMPEGFSSAFEFTSNARRHSLTLDVSLLLEEQAFYIHVGSGDVFPGTRAREFFSPAHRPWAHPAGLNIGLTGLRVGKTIRARRSLPCLLLRLRITIPDP